VPAPVTLVRRDYGRTFWAVSPARGRHVLWLIVGVGLRSSEPALVDTTRSTIELDCLCVGGVVPIDDS